MNDVPRIGKGDHPVDKSNTPRQAMPWWGGLLFLSIPTLALFIPLCVWLTRLAFS